MIYQMSCRIRRGVALGVIAMVSASLLLFAGPKPEKGEFLVVRVGVRNFLVTPPKVKAGPVRVLVENSTVILSPAIGIRLQNSKNEVDTTKLDKPTNSKPRESWHDVVLTPGTYWVSIDQVPGVQAALVVEP